MSTDDGMTIDDVNDDFPDDLPSQLTQLLRNVDGVHTVYATERPVPTVITAVVELVKNEPVGLHLVTVDETDDAHTVDIIACIGIAADEPAPVVCRRAHDAIQKFVTEESKFHAATITVKIGRVG
ncbi:hypothetical protein BH09ACT1_BH09ACT1_22220 [soil metagenome]